VTAIPGRAGGARRVAGSDQSDGESGVSANPPDRVDSLKDQPGRWQVSGTPEAQAASAGTPPGSDVPGPPVGKKFRAVVAVALALVPVAAARRALRGAGRRAGDAGGRSGRHRAGPRPHRRAGRRPAPPPRRLRHRSPRHRRGRCRNGDVGREGRWSAQAPQGRYDLAVSTPDPTVSAKVRDVDVAADSRLNLELAGNAMQPVHFSARVVDGAGDPVLPGGVRSAPWRSSTWRRAGRRIQPGPRSRCIWR